jgi:hypothetical protein
MIDAFGFNIDIGDDVIGIANVAQTQTFYCGKVTKFMGNCVEVKITKSADILENAEPYSSHNDRRVCLSYRLVKL